MYSSDWNPRSYCYVLLLFCYCIPLCIIFFSYVGIIYHNSRLPAKPITTPSSSIRYEPTLSIDNQDGEANDVKNEPPLHHAIQMQRKQRRNTEDYLKVSNVLKAIQSRRWMFAFLPPNISNWTSTTYVLGYKGAEQAIKNIFLADFHVGNSLDTVCIHNFLDYWLWR